MLSFTDEELQANAEKLQQVYATDIREDFVLEVRSFLREFMLELQELSIYRGRAGVASFRKHALVDAGTGDCMCAALYIAVDSFPCQLSFSKLKLIKSKQCSMLAEDRLDHLVFISNGAAELQLDALVNKSAETKAHKNISETHES